MAVPRTANGCHFYSITGRQYLNTDSTLRKMNIYFLFFHIIFLVCFMNKTLVPFSGQIKWTTGCARDLSGIDFLTTVSKVRKIRTGL